MSKGIFVIFFSVFVGAQELTSLKEKCIDKLFESQYSIDQAVYGIRLSPELFAALFNRMNLKVLQKNKFRLCALITNNMISIEDLNLNIILSDNYIQKIKNKELQARMYACKLVYAFNSNDTLSFYQGYLIEEQFKKLKDVFSTNKLNYVHDSEKIKNFLYYANKRSFFEHDIKKLNPICAQELKDLDFGEKTVEDILALRSLVATIDDDQIINSRIFWYKEKNDYHELNPAHGYITLLMNNQKIKSKIKNELYGSRDKLVRAIVSDFKGKKLSCLDDEIIKIQSLLMSVRLINDNKMVDSEYVKCKNLAINCLNRLITEIFPEVSKKLYPAIPPA